MLMLELYGRCYRAGERHLSVALLVGLGTKNKQTRWDGWASESVALLSWKKKKKTTKENRKETAGEWCLEELDGT